MKFLNYINENSQTIKISKPKDFDDVWSILESKCKYCIDIMRKTNRVIGRDFAFSKLGGQFSQSEIVKAKVRKDRQPLDTPVTLHNILNDLLYKKFGKKLRMNTLFGKVYKGIPKFQAETTSGSAIILPVGRFKIYWHPTIVDLYMHLRKLKMNIPVQIVGDVKEIFRTNISPVTISNSIDNERFDRERTPLIIKWLSEHKELTDIIDNYKVSETIPNTATEIMVDCNEYYAIPQVSNQRFKYFFISKIEGKI